MRALSRCAPYIVMALTLFRTTQAAEPVPQVQLDRARAIRERALADDVGYELLRSLTTEVGPRSAGSAGDARAVSWALAHLRALGFKNVHAESVTVSHWIRGEARAEITAPWPQPLLPVALGGSSATPAEGVEAEVGPVTSLARRATTPPAAG